VHVCVVQGVQYLMDDYKERPLYKAAHIFFLESEDTSTHIHPYCNSAHHTAASLPRKNLPSLGRTSPSLVGTFPP